MSEYEQITLAKNQRFAIIARLVLAVAFAAVALISFAKLADQFSSPEAYSHEIEQRDNRKETAATLSVVAAAASAGVTVIPDDICTPIAQQLAEISKDLGIVTGAVILEKYAMTILGFAVFRFILPLAMLVLAVCAVVPASSPFKDSCVAAVLRVLLASLIIWYSVPLGVRASDMIFDTYEETINNAIENAKLAEELTKQKDEASRRSDAAAADRKLEFSIEGFVDALASIPSAIANVAGSVASSASDKVSVLVAWAKVVLTQITEGFAVLVVTTCIIPLLVPLLMFWLAKLLLQPSSASLPSLPQFASVSLLPSADQNPLGSPVRNRKQ